jgi:hypothetical protein
VKIVAGQRPDGTQIFIYEELKNYRGKLFIKSNFGQEWDKLL